jgi:hypothetical protein
MNLLTSLIVFFLVTQNMFLSVLIIHVRIYCELSRKSQRHTDLCRRIQCMVGLDSLLEWGLASYDKIFRRKMNTAPPFERNGIIR